jgi:hypothetical protein
VVVAASRGPCSRPDERTEAPGHLRDAIYAREGVRHLWFVDPLARTLEVYRLEDGHWIVASTHGGDDVVCAEPFDALEIGLERWWLESADPGA